MTNLSVVIPAYNSSSTLRQCLKSIVESEYKDYEVIVVNDASTDETSKIAEEYKVKLINLTEKKGRNYAREQGWSESKGDIIVNIDSDVIIKPDTLKKITGYFKKHPAIDAVTGMLSKNHTRPDYFSQYKNLYMNYIFKKLPENVTFLYGSIFALRKESITSINSTAEIADDTALGQELFSMGKRISFLIDLKVIHLKKYNFISFFRNDFVIPRDWAKIFLENRGWNQLGKNKMGFAHASVQQIISVVLAPFIIITSIFSLGFILLLTVLWLLLNFNFFLFLVKEKGFFFGIISIFITFCDNIVMLAGIVYGIFFYLMDTTIGKKR